MTLLYCAISGLCTPPAGSESELDAKHKLKRHACEGRGGGGEHFLAVILFWTSRLARRAGKKTKHTRRCGMFDELRASTSRGRDAADIPRLHLTIFMHTNGNKEKKKEKSKHQTHDFYLNVGRRERFGRVLNRLGLIGGRCSFSFYSL